MTAPTTLVTFWLVTYGFGGGQLIAANDRDRWLNGNDPQELLRPYPAEQMMMWPVSMRANSPRNDDPTLLERVDYRDTEPSSSSNVEHVNEGAPERKPANSE